MTDYVKQLTGNYAGLSGQTSDPTVFDAEFDTLATVSSTKMDKVGGTFTGHISVPAGATGTQAAQKSEIDADMALKADIVSPTLSDLTVTGTCTIPASSGTTSPYQKAEVDSLLTSKASLASPSFTGTPTAPNHPTSDSSTNLATTYYVHTMWARTRTWKAGVASKTNIAGREIEIAVFYNTTNLTINSVVSVVINGRTILLDETRSSLNSSFSFTVPNNTSYSITSSNATITISELS